MHAMRFEHGGQRTENIQKMVLANLSTFFSSHTFVELCAILGGQMAHVVIEPVFILNISLVQKARRLDRLDLSFEFGGSPGNQKMNWKSFLGIAGVRQGCHHFLRYECFRKFGVWRFIRMARAKHWGIQV